MLKRGCLFVAPALGGEITGGNLYNLGLVTALRAAGVAVRVIERDGRRFDADREELCLVDSLYLAELPRFAPCWLLAHYLPTLVEGRESLSPVERAALVAADGIVVPSVFMADALARLAPEKRAFAIVAPGLELEHPEVTRVPRALLVANLVPGKGVLELLRALGSRRFQLAVVGALDHDAAYVAACRAAAPWVDFLGPRSHPETLAAIAASDFLISASRMESFGLALAEGRALGVPIVALARGNASAHVDESAGGRLLGSYEALADECFRLAHDAAELERRRGAALAGRPPPRAWADAARDFTRAFTD